jgi:hypothetical protein
MKLVAHFYLLNEHFSQEHADAQHNGEESENNYKIEWEDELALNSNVSNVEMVEKGSYSIAGSFPDGKDFSFEINNMRVFKFYSTDGTVTEFACSEEALDSFDLKEEKDEFTLKIFMKGEEPTINPIPGIYIINQDFPEELIGN